MEPEQRRRRPAVSCIPCRKRKIRCDKQLPCSNCTKSRNATCLYKDDPRTQRKRGTFGETVQTLGGSGAVVGNPRAAASSSPEPRPPGATRATAAATNTTTLDANTVSTISGTYGNSSCDLPHSSETYVKPLGKPVSAQPASTGESSVNTPVSTLTKNSLVETKTLNFAGKFYFHSEHRHDRQSKSVTRSVSHKTRFFGQSHWVTFMGLLSDMYDFIERYLRDESKSRVLHIERRSKALGRIIKKRRSPPWPCPLSSDLPAKVVADTLVENYLSTSESVLRVLHIPSFRREYEAVWDPSHTPDPAFLVQLKLVMAIGATTYDTNFSLRPHAIRWVYEGQTWLTAPEFKSRLGLTALQNCILIHLAREAAGVGEDMVWAIVGTTIRIAMYMGLHRDPAGLGPRTMTPLIAEMRRRLWNTILELALQSSLNAGGPPLISLDNFDTEPPGNFDDDQLADRKGETPSPKSPDQFTQTTVAIALRSVFAQRLAIVKYLNGLPGCGDYQETLQLDAQLREAYKNVTNTLQVCKKTTSDRSPPPDLGLRIADLILRQYFLALHVPHFAPAMQETAFAFSRRVVIETVVRLWRAVFPHRITLSQPDARTEEPDPLQRMVTNGAGFFRTISTQGMVAIAIELKTLMREEEGFGLGPVELRPDLLAVLEDIKAWLWKCQESGVTNTKGYLIVSIVCALVDAMRKRMTEEDTIAHVLRAAEEAEERSLELLERIEVSTRPTHEALDVGVDGISGDMGFSPDLGMEGWNSMMTNTLFDITGQDPISWVFQESFA